MIDAYTIGITVALEDGVSEGIAEIRRELVALDAATSKSLAQIEMLRQVASTVGIAQVRQVAQPQAPSDSVAGPTVSPLIQETQAAKQDGTPRSATSSRSEVASIIGSGNPVASPGRGSVAAAPVSSPIWIPNSNRTANDGDARPVDRIAQAAVATPVPSTPHAAPIRVSVPTADRTNPESHPSAGLAEHVRPDARSLAPATRVPVPAGDIGIDGARANPISSSARPADEGPRRAAAPLLPLGNSILSDVPPIAIHPSTHVRMTHSAFSPPDDTRGQSAGPPAAVRAAAPVDTPRQAAAAQATPSAGNPLRQRDAQAVSAPVASQPLHGEILLDGVALGRWITRYLERQVSRPPAGVTGVDTRMSPSWPGAPADN